jgi:methyl-accepting chemotaxis protein
MRNLSHGTAGLNDKIRLQVETSKQIVQETHDVVNAMAMRDMGSLGAAKEQANRLFDKLSAMNEHISAQLGQVSQITQDIDRSVGLAVQSLQFEDIVGQLLTHADRELGEQEQVLSELSASLRTFAEDARSHGGSETGFLELQARLRAIQRAGMSQKSTAVLQQSMDEGDVELF